MAIEYFDITNWSSFLQSAGFAGIALTALISSIGYFLKNRREAKKSAKRVLYILLEIRYAISIAIYDPTRDIDKYLHSYSEAAKKRGLDIDPKVFNEFLGEMIKSHFLNLAHASKTDIQERLLSPFEDALSDLSSTSPILAFKLRGKEKLEKLASVTSSYAESAISRIQQEEAPPWAIDAIANSINEQAESSIHEVFEKLNKDIIKLAFHCGIIQYIQIRKSPRSRFTLFHSEFSSDLEKSLDRFLEQMVVAAKANTQPTSN